MSTPLFSACSSVQGGTAGFRHPGWFRVDKADYPKTVFKLLHKPKPTGIQ